MADLQRLSNRCARAQNVAVHRYVLNHTRKESTLWRKKPQGPTPSIKTFLT